MILVTGGSGFVGSSLVKKLERDGRSFMLYGSRLEEEGQLETALNDAEAVIHLAGAETRNRLRLLRQVDIEGTEKLLKTCRRVGVTRVLVLSRLNADPNSHYALLKAKGIAERKIRESGLDFTIVRSSTLFGREDRFLNTITAMAVWSWPVVWVPGKGRVALQPLWVEDLVRCLISCLDRTDLIGRTVEVAGSERLRYEELVREVLHTAGIKRFMISPSVKLVRPLSTLLFGWWRRPPVTRWTMDRFSVPEAVPLDSVIRHFGFHPSRFSQRISYLRRSHPGLVIFR